MPFNGIFTRNWANSLKLRKLTKASKISEKIINFRIKPFYSEYFYKKPVFGTSRYFYKNVTSLYPPYFALRWYLYLDLWMYLRTLIFAIRKPEIDKSQEVKNTQNKNVKSLKCDTRIEWKIKNSIRPGIQIIRNLSVFMIRKP